MGVVRSDKTVFEAIAKFVSEVNLCSRDHCRRLTQPLSHLALLPVLEYWKDTNLFAVTSSGSTPFLAGCEGGRVNVVRTLMEKAISLSKLEEMCNAKDANGKTPFEMAAAGQHKVYMPGNMHS